MSLPFDDTDGEDWRPETVADNLIAEVDDGADVWQALKSEMDRFYLDESGQKPRWDRGDVEIVIEAYNHEREKLEQDHRLDASDSPF